MNKIQKEVWNQSPVIRADRLDEVDWSQFDKEPYQLWVYVEIWDVEGDRPKIGLRYTGRSLESSITGIVKGYRDQFEKPSREPSETQILFNQLGEGSLRFRVLEIHSPQTKTDYSLIQSWSSGLKEEETFDLLWSPSDSQTPKRFLKTREDWEQELSKEAEKAEKMAEKTRRIVEEEARRAEKKSRPTPKKRETPVEPLIAHTDDLDRLFEVHPDRSWDSLCPLPETKAGTSFVVGFRFTEGWYITQTFNPVRFLEDFLYYVDPSHRGGDSLHHNLCRKDTEAGIGIFVYLLHVEENPQGDEASRCGEYLRQSGETIASCPRGKMAFWRPKPSYTRGESMLSRKKPVGDTEETLRDSWEDLRRTMEEIQGELRETREDFRRVIQILSSWVGEL